MLELFGLLENGLPLVYVSPLIISVVLGFFLALFVARNRTNPGSGALLTLVIGASLWSLGYALEILAPGLESKLFWAKFQYFGITTVPLAWLIFAVQHLGAPRWLAGRLQYRILVTTVPALTLILVWSNELHNLVWRDVRLQTIGPVQMLVIDHGPWFWVYLVFAYILMFLGSFRLVWGVLNSIRLHRWQIVSLLLAALIPWIGNLVYITDLGPGKYLDLTPFSFTIAALLFTISLFRFRLVKILPIAQRAVFAGLSDCLIVLDMQDRIVDLNPAAQKMIGHPGEKLFGALLAQVAPELAHWVMQASLDEEIRMEISQGDEPDKRFYDLYITPLKGQYARPVGRLILYHEITQLKRDQARLERVVSDRTEELRRTVEQLQRELAQRTLAEKRFEEVVESAPDAMFLIDREGAIRLVNTQAERMFNYSRDELLGQKFDKLVSMHRRDRHRDYLMQFVSSPSIKQINYDLNLSALRKDGSEFPAEISLGPLNTVEGVWVACSIRDVTERKKAEEAQNQLVEELKQSREQLSALAVRLEEVQEIERRQVASELHDRIGQNLTGLNLNLQVIENQLSPEASEVVGQRLNDSQKLLEETTRQVRNVMAELHPPMLDEYGLLSAMNWYCADFSRRTGIATRVIGDEFKPRLARNDEMVLFRLVQEALNNVAKHAHATQVEINVESSQEGACLIIQDNGLGFDPRALHEATDQPHWGLINMEQRAASIGGRLVVDSAPGQGTRVAVRIQRS